MRSGIVLVVTAVLYALSFRASPIHRLLFPAVHSHLGAIPHAGKRGLAWSNTSCGDVAKFGGSIHLYHRWSPNGNGCWDEPDYFIPTFWCDVLPGGANGYADWQAKIAPNYSGLVYVLNEPDRPPPQCNRTEQQAAAIFRQFQTICPRCQMIAMHISGADLGWTGRWREAYRQMYGEYPVVAGYGLHLYGSRASIMSRAVQFHNLMVSWGEGHKRLDIGEFGGCWAAYQTQLSPADLQALIDFFESDTRFTSYSFYPIRWAKPGDPLPPGNCPALLNASGNLTSIGSVYANYQPSAYPPPLREEMSPLSYP